jgi:proteic killer suppression protein
VPSSGPEPVDPAADLARCFLRLANLPNFALDRLSRYEAILWRQVGQILFALDTLDRRKPQDRGCRFRIGGLIPEDRILVNRDAGRADSKISHGGNCEIQNLIRTAYHHIKTSMIRLFRCKDTQRIWQGQPSRKFPGDIQDRALRRLRQLDAATTLEDLRNPPGNRLEVLKGNRVGQMSIRINDQWRICFRWIDHDA